MFYNQQNNFQNQTQLSQESEWILGQLNGKITFNSKALSWMDVFLKDTIDILRVGADNVHTFASQNGFRGYSSLPLDRYFHELYSNGLKNAAIVDLFSMILPVVDLYVARGMDDREFSNIDIRKSIIGSTMMAGFIISMGELIRSGRLPREFHESGDMNIVVDVATAYYRMTMDRCNLFLVNEFLVQRKGFNVYQPQQYHQYGQPSWNHPNNAYVPHVGNTDYIQQNNRFNPQQRYGGNRYSGGSVNNGYSPNGYNPAYGSRFNPPRRQEHIGGNSHLSFNGQGQGGFNPSSLYGQPQQNQTQHRTYNDSSDSFGSVSRREIERHEQEILRKRKEREEEVKQTPKHNNHIGYPNHMPNAPASNCSQQHSNAQRLSIAPSNSKVGQQIKAQQVAQYSHDRNSDYLEEEFSRKKQQMYQFLATHRTGKTSVSEDVSMFYTADGSRFLCEDDWVPTERQPQLRVYNRLTRHQLFVRNKENEIIQFLIDIKGIEDKLKEIMDRYNETHDKELTMNLLHRLCSDYCISLPSGDPDELFADFKAWCVWYSQNHVEEVIDGDSPFSIDIKGIEDEEIIGQTMENILADNADDEGQDELIVASLSTKVLADKDNRTDTYLDEFKSIVDGYHTGKYSSIGYALTTLLDTMAEYKDCKLVSVHKDLVLSAYYNLYNFRYQQTNNHITVDSLLDDRRELVEDLLNHPYSNNIVKDLFGILSDGIRTEVIVDEKRGKSYNVLSNLCIVSSNLDKNSLLNVSQAHVTHTMGKPTYYLETESLPLVTAYMDTVNNHIRKAIIDKTNSKYMEGHQVDNIVPYWYIKTSDDQYLLAVRANKDNNCSVAVFDLGNRIGDIGKHPMCIY